MAMFEVTLVKEIFTAVTHTPGGFIDPRKSASRIFVCGSLMDPAFGAGIIGRPPAMCPALARGFTRGQAEYGGKLLQFLIPEQGGVTQGMALLGLSESEIEKLDAFEQASQIRRKINLDGVSFEKLLIGNIELEGSTYIRNDHA